MYLLHLFIYLFKVMLFNKDIFGNKIRKPKAIGVFLINLFIYLRKEMSVKREEKGSANNTTLHFTFPLASAAYLVLNIY